jgi:hypothetical protein
MVKLLTAASIPAVFASMSGTASMFEGGAIIIGMPCTTTATAVAIGTEPTAVAITGCATGISAMVDDDDLRGLGV